MKHRIIYFILLILGFMSCNEERVKNNYAFDTLVQKSLKSYFEMDTIPDHLLCRPEYSINGKLNFKNVLDSNTILEIRLYSSRDFDTTFLYSLQYSQSNQWSGKVYKLEYISSKIISQSNFAPQCGWSKFEKTIINNDILNSNIDSVINKRQCDFLHPRGYSIQILTPTQMRLIRYQDFDLLINRCKMNEYKLLRVQAIVNSIIK